MEGVAIDKSALKWMQLSHPADTFDRLNHSAFCRGGEREAGIRASAIDQDRTGAAGTHIASLLRTSQSKPIVKDIQQGVCWFDRNSVDVSVDVQVDLHGSQIYKRRLQMTRLSVVLVVGLSA